MEIQEAINYINAFYSKWYSKTARISMKAVCKEFLKHLQQTKMEYSEEIAQDWLTTKMKENDGVYLHIVRYYHAVNLIIDVVKTGTLEYGRRYGFVRTPKKPCSHVWQIILSEYLSELLRESKTASTIQFSRIASTKFIMFLEGCGCMAPTGLSRELCLRYEAETNGHSTNNGKRAYQYRIRMFIRYLGRKKLVDRMLEHAIKTTYRIPCKVVTTLSKEQKREICAARKSDDDSLNRSYAMAMLALYLGLRSVDIINLKFSAISWLENSVKLVQQKTKKEMVLPLIPVVGNAIIDYVLNHRPESHSPYVFVSHRFPFGRLQSSSTCFAASARLIAQRPDGQPSGMHIMRRTLASDLLRCNVKHELVSGFLGHASPLTINPYLSIDQERMMQCPIPLGPIGVPEVFK